MLSKRNFETHFGITLRSFYQRSVHFTAVNYYCINIKVCKVLSDLFKIKHTEFLILLYFACHIPQFKMLIMPFFERRLDRAKLTFL